uniref:Uncharacterized protein n=1 Tax=Setaria viridis TaxID=4556 RepID=A0A4U6V1H4_SETVI|nr:hypothetical protein SEVIR_4G147101v2 [Setaria viridis]
MHDHTVQAIVPAAPFHSPQGTHDLRRPEQREDSPILGPRAPGSGDVTPSLHEPSSGRRHPPSLPTDTGVTTKCLHHNPAPTDTEEAICRARRQLTHGRPPPPAYAPAHARGRRGRRAPRNLVSPFLPYFYRTTFKLFTALITQSQL